MISWSMCRTLPGEIGPTLGDGEPQGLLPAFFFCSNRTLTVSFANGRVHRRFYFQGRFGDLSVNLRHLPLNPEVAPLQINILPLQPQKLTTPQAGSQLR